MSNPSEITNSTSSTIYNHSFEGPIHSAPLKGEDVFIAHLYHRAQLLNPEFQEEVLKLVHGHAAPEIDLQEADIEEPEQEPFMAEALKNNSPVLGQTVVVEIDSSAPSICNRGGAAVNASNSAGVQINTANLIFQNNAELGGTPFNSADCKNKFGRHMLENNATASAGICTACSVLCVFSEGSSDHVEVCAGTVKTQARMREKLAEYAMEGFAWPLTACILDPVRVSVVCNGPARILEVANWFISAGSVNLTDPADTGELGPGREKLLVCRIKNKFSLRNFQLVSYISRIEY